MIQAQTMVDVADNSGAKQAQVIRVLTGSTSGGGRRSLRRAVVGDIVIVTVKKAMPNSEFMKAGNRKARVQRAVVVRSKYPVRRVDGSYVRFDRNAVVLVDPNNEPRGTRIFGAVARELREKNFMKIVSLASEVV